MPASPEQERGGRPDCPLLRRGGAHCRSDRKTWQLTEAQCRHLLDAVEESCTASRPFNRFITVAWGPCGLTPLDSVTATGRWITLARDWLRQHGGRLRWAWVQEHGRTLGPHAHILLHVPPELNHLFRAGPRRWMQRVLMEYGLTYARRAIQSQKIRPLFLDDTANARTHAWHTAIMPKAHYMLKCAPADLEVAWGLVGAGPKPWGQRCQVHGKRLGTWQRDRGHDLW